ncbi:putative glutathione S-transferase [Gorgonomyces haynaldii]|nr:putative glutathione S-transferase [Gorgonomyces haynaldii]
MPPLSEKPVLHYFDLENKGRGEVVRLFFALAKIEYMDKRIPMSEWPKTKQEFARGKSLAAQIPVIDFEGRVFTNHIPILKYFSKRFDLYAVSGLEQEYIADVVCDIYVDWRAKWVTNLFNPQPDYTKTNEFYMKLFEKHYQNGPFLFGAKPSYVDCAVYQALHDDGSLGKLSAYPALQKFQAAFEDIPHVKLYLQSRQQHVKA